MVINRASPSGKNSVRFFPPSFLLKQKVGEGGLDEAVLKKAETYIANHDLDFEMYATNYLKRLDALLSDAKMGIITGKEALNALSGPVMELKANGGMFKYTLVSEVADVALNFIENVEELNDDGFELIAMHQRTLYAIFANHLTGTGGKEGRALAEELYGACKRYYKKHGMNHLA